MKLSKLVISVVLAGTLMVAVQAQEHRIVSRLSSLI